MIITERGKQREDQVFDNLRLLGMAIRMIYSCTTHLWIVFVLLSFSFVFCFGTKSKELTKCEPLNVEQCRGIVGYNVMGIPNIFGDTRQADIELKLMDINVLLTSNCALPVRFFFCSMYAPMCSPKTKTLITSCRPLCEHVTKQCRPTAEKFGISWPKTWNCSQFHRDNNYDGQMCMQGPLLNTSNVVDTHASSTETPQYGKKSFKNSQNYIYLERVKSWVLLCAKDGIFTADNKDFAELWMTVWAIVCFISTGVTVLTFLVDTQRFRYPERSIVMLAFCYNLSSIGYIIRIIVGRESVSCEDNEMGTSYVTQHGLGNPVCAFVFLILYFFAMAANIWWVILALTWFLAAGMKWSYEAIGSYSNLFHLVAWLLPVIKTVLVLIFRKVDGDELTGLCYVGNQDLLALTGFVLGPQFTYLIIGALFLVAGFIALYRIRLTIQKEGLTKTDKLDRFIIRIGVFSLLSTVPATSIIASQFYEYSNRENWLYGRTQPNINVLMLKLCMSQFVGIIAGMWMWTPKTCVSWKNFYLNKCLRQSNVPNSSNNNNLALRNEATVAATQPFHYESEV